MGIYLTGSIQVSYKKESEWHWTSQRKVEQSSAFKSKREIYFQLRILYPTKLSIKCKSKDIIWHLVFQNIYCQFIFPYEVLGGHVRVFF